LRGELKTGKKGIFVPGDDQVEYYLGKEGNYA
jgi:hypothetical protein